ncbi:MAG TPA: PDZ domain-containing protein [Candidatus Sulfopaludibacter sp.]|jgi:serine protease Do|nr:PDZ domain-containing protein [Candidatus Sulfopaludibacter sp.]
MRSYIQIGIALATAAALMAQQKSRDMGPEVVVQRDGSYLGIGGQGLDSDRAKALKLKDDRGVEITQVDPDGPASKAGFKSGDVVLEFNGTAVEGTEHLQRLVREVPAGHTVKITVWRNGAAQTLTAVLGQRKGMWIETPGGEFSVMVPPPPAMPATPAMSMPRMITIMPSGMLGIEGEPLNQEPQFAEFMGVKDGVLVKSVNRNSAAERAGIKAGDVIVKVDEAHVSSAMDITAALRASHGKKNFNLTLVRNKREMPLSVTLE